MPRRIDDVIHDGDEYWVELHGGPFDGQMAQLVRHVIRFKGGKTRVVRGFVVDVPAPGHYVEDGWADEELPVVRMSWDPSAD